MSVELKSFEWLQGLVYFQMIPNLSAPVVHTVTSYAANSYDGLPIIFIVTQYMIKVIGNHFV